MMGNLWQQIIDADTKNQTVMEVKADGNRPSYANEYAAGLDIRASIDNPITIKAGEVAEVPTKLAVAIPNGCFGLVTIRSGLGFKFRLQMNNTVGIIDSDYFYSDNEGHIFVKLTNDTNEGKTVSVAQGTGMVQGIFMQYGVTIDDDATEVRNGGFGSTTK